MGNIPSRSPYPGQFITLCFDQSWPFRAWSRTSQWKNTSCHPLFVHSPPVLLCCRSYSQTRLPSMKACLFYKGTLVALEWSSSPCSLWFIALGLTALRLSSSLWCRSHQRNSSSIALQWVSSPCSHYRHLVVTPSPCCPLSHSLAVSLVALQSVSSLSCQPPRLAVGRLEICLTALQSALSHCSRPRHLAVGPITLQLLTLFQLGEGGWNPPPSGFFLLHRHKNQPIDSTLSTF